MWANTKAIALLAAASQNPFRENLYQSHILSMEMYIKMLLEYQKHLSKFEEEIVNFLVKKYI